MEEDYNVLYVAVWGDGEHVEPGSLMFWDDHGLLHDLEVIDLRTREIRRIATISKVADMDPDTVKCIRNGLNRRDRRTICKCIPDIAKRLDEAIRRAGYTNYDYKILYDRAYQNACGGDRDG